MLRLFCTLFIVEILSLASAFCAVCEIYLTKIAAPTVLNLLQAAPHYPNQFLLLSRFGSVHADRERKTFLA